MCRTTLLALTLSEAGANLALRLLLCWSRPSERWLTICSLPRLEPHVCSGAPESAWWFVI